MNYEIKDIGNVIEVDDKERINLLETLIYVGGFKDRKMLEKFAKGFKDVPSLM